MRVGALVARHRIDAFPDRPVGLDAVTHELQVVAPLDAVQRTEVHQDLAVHTQVEQQADVGLGQGPLLVVGQVEVGDRRGAVGVVRRLHSRIPVQQVQELLRLIQAHGASHSTSKRSGPRKVMLGKNRMCWSAVRRSEGMRWLSASSTMRSSTLARLAPRQ